MKGRNTVIAFAAAATAMAGAAVAEHVCYKTVAWLPACTTGGCNSSAACDQVQYADNEIVKFTMSGGNRWQSVPLHYACVANWNEEDPETGACNVPAGCDFTVQGAQASGGTNCNESVHEW